MTALENAGYVNPSLIETKAVQNPSKKVGAKVLDDSIYNEFTIYFYLPKFETEEPKTKKGVRNGNN